ncbi:MAG: hypothetical protein ACYC97_05635 [Metallibacterium sp.]
MLTFAEVAMCILSFIVGVSFTLVIIYFPKEKESCSRKYKQQVKEAICALRDDIAYLNKKICERTDRTPEEISLILDRLHALESQVKGNKDEISPDRASYNAFQDNANKLSKNPHDTGNVEQVTMRRGADGKFKKVKQEAK